MKAVWRLPTTGHLQRYVARALAVSTSYLVHVSGPLQSPVRLQNEISRELYTAEGSLCLE